MGFGKFWDGVRQLYADSAARVAPITETRDGDCAGGPIPVRKQAFRPCRVTRRNSPLRAEYPTPTVLSAGIRDHIANIQRAVFCF